MLPLAVTSEDRRRHPRIDLPSSPGLLDGHRLIEALTLSAGGMLIRLPSEVSLDQPVRVEIQLGDATFRAEARVVFLGPDLSSAPGAEQRYRVGLAFVDASPADQALLDHFIAQELAARRGR
jgi:c-di-GMP-binding flagellar brake protein YcgR